MNLEYLARVVFSSTDVEDGEGDRMPLAYPDTLVGTDSHTTMINGLGVLGWGVGGIEAEAAMLGQPVSMLVPQVVGFKLIGALREGATATDLVLTVTEMLRRKGVVGKFVEFYGDGLANLPLADRATIANMAPEYGATCGIFPIDAETLRYLELSGRPASLVRLVEAYAKEQGLFHDGRGPRGGVHRHARARPGDASSRAWPARSGRRTASRCTRRRPSFAERAEGDARVPARRRRRPSPSRRPRRPTSRASSASKAKGAAGRPSASRTRPPRRPRIARSARATSRTARSSSRRSPAAPTRRTRRSWSPPACSPRRPSSAGCRPSPGSRPASPPARRS